MILALQSFTNAHWRSFSQSSVSITPASNVGTPLASDNNSEEWLGLDYALEVSKADFQPQKIEDDCAEGEYSKVCGDSPEPPINVHLLPCRVGSPGRRSTAPTSIPVSKIGLSSNGSAGTVSSS